MSDASAAAPARTPTSLPAASTGVHVVLMSFGFRNGRPKGVEVAAVHTDGTDHADAGSGNEGGRGCDGEYDAGVDAAGLCDAIIPDRTESAGGDESEKGDEEDSGEEGEVEGEEEDDRGDDDEEEEEENDDDDHGHVPSESFHTRTLSFADVFNCRVLRNPSAASRRGRTGLDARLRDEVLETSGVEAFIQTCVGAIADAVPHAAAEGAAHLAYGFGCEHGKHRSVSVCIETARRLHALKLAGLVDITAVHRDIDGGARGRACRDDGSDDRGSRWRGEDKPPRQGKAARRQQQQQQQRRRR